MNSTADLNALICRAADHARRGDHAGALHCTERLIALRPEDALSWRLKGECLFRLERYPESIAALELAWALDPIGGGDALLLVAHAHAALGDGEAAADAVNRLLERAAPAARSALDASRALRAAMPGQFRANLAALLAWAEGADEMVRGALHLIAALEGALIA